MILVHITKQGIEKVMVEAASEAEEEIDLKIWPVVRRGLNRLNHDLAQREGRKDQPSKAT